jgi:hypothetical protein
MQDLSYEYDDRLNLTRRTDALQGMSDHFEHDKLDRLVCADFDPAPGCTLNQEYSYAYNGNLLHKPGFGLIAYDPEHPHAAESGSGGPSRTTPSETRSHELAPRSSTRLSISRSGSRSIKAVSSSWTTTATRRGSARQRRSKETIYLGDLYERVTDKSTGAVQHQFYVSLALVSWV